MTPDTGADRLARSTLARHRRNASAERENEREAEHFDQTLAVHLERHQDTRAADMTTTKPTPTDERIAKHDTLVPRPDLGPHCHTLVPAGHPLPDNHQPKPSED